MAEKMRVMYIIGQLGVGGAERQLVQLVTHLDRSRFSPLVCSLTDDSALAADLEAAEVPVILLRKWMSPDLSRGARLLALTRQHRPDVIHSYLWAANFWARIVGTVTRVPVIISERNVEFDKPLIMQLVDRLMSGAAAMLVANTREGMKLAVRRSEICAERATCIPNGLVPEQNAGPDDIERVRQRVGLGAGGKIIGIFGRLAPQKDHETFFRAMRIVRDARPDTKVLCAGDGPLAKEIRRHVFQLGLESNVVFVGLRQDIPDLMQVLDVLVSSSRWEGMPNVILEAMAAGKPVVATAVGGVPEVVIDGRTGLLVRPGQPAELARAILALLSDPEAARRMGEAGAARARQEFSVSQMVRRHEEVYRQVVDGNRGRGNLRQGKHGH